MTDAGGKLHPKGVSLPLKTQSLSFPILGKREGLSGITERATSVWYHFFTYLAKTAKFDDVLCWRSCVETATEHSFLVET